MHHQKKTKFRSLPSGGVTCNSIRSLPRHRPNLRYNLLLSLNLPKCIHIQRITNSTPLPLPHTPHIPLNKSPLSPRTIRTTTLPPSKSKQTTPLPFKLIHPIPFLTH